MSQEHLTTIPKEATHEPTTRRSFLKKGVGVGAGIASGVAFFPVARKVNQVTEDITGHRAGNAGSWEHIDRCQKHPEAIECLPENELPLSIQVERLINPNVTIPLMEEMIFRKIPSDYFFKEEDAQKKERDEPISPKLTRREVLIGVGTSTIFGAAHNITSISSIDTETIPASQTVHGGFYWYLQRKLGFASNYFSHVTNNFLGMISK